MWPGFDSGLNAKRGEILSSTLLRDVFFLAFFFFFAQEKIAFQWYKFELQIWVEFVCSLLCSEGL